MHLTNPLILSNHVPDALYLSDYPLYAFEVLFYPSYISAVNNPCRFPQIL